MKNEKGVTLIEIIVSIVLFLLCLGGISAIIQQCTETSQSVYFTYEATNLAKNRIEWIREFRRTKGYAALATLPEEQVDYIDVEGNAGEDFKRTTEIEYSTDETTIKVTVEYLPKAAGAPVKAELVTMFFKY